MTIRFTSAVDGYAVNAVATLGAVPEAAYVARGVAVYYASPSNPTNRGVGEDRIARFALDSSGNVTGLVGQSGTYIRLGPIGASSQVVPGRRFRGTYGRKVASWGALQNSAGTAALVTGDLPTFSDNATYALKLTRNTTASFGQQNPIDGSQGYLPTGTSPGFSMGVWVKNPNGRSLNFELKVYNAAANKTMSWNCCADSNNGQWTFLTCSPSQQINGSSWTLGTDIITYVRITQVDSGAEGAWLPGEYLLFSNVYADVRARPRFMLQFDDGRSSQRNPIASSIQSGSAYVSSSLTNVFTTNAAHGLVIGAPIRFTDTAPTSLSVGTTYYVATVPTTTTFTLATDQFTLASTAASTGFSGTANWVYAGSQERSAQGIVESYGFRGCLFIVPAWLGTSGLYGYGGGTNTFMSVSDVQAMWAAGWSVGSHSTTHPSNNENAGLRLLGPYGYYLSNTVDNLPARYVSAWSLGASNRRRVTAGTQASPSAFTTENAHQFLVNSPIVFTDVAPTGCTLGVTYYIRSTPTTTTFTLATDQGTLTSAVNNTTGAWSGTANYRWPGSSNDDSAIYADIMSGISGIAALGIPTGSKFFALPQGAADEYVRSACQRAGLSWIRGVSATSATNAHSIPVGMPTGGGLTSLINNNPGGWIAQIDSVQTDGATPTFATIKTYADDTITQGACGCCYHHDITTANLPQLDQLCAYLRNRVDAGALDVLTLDELALAYEF